MRNAKRDKAMLLVLMLLMVMFLLPESIQAVEKIKLNTTKLTLAVNTTYQLELLNAVSSKVTYTTSNQKIATVTKTGTIIAKKKGTCKILAKYKGRTYSCKVVVTKGNTRLKFRISNKGKRTAVSTAIKDSMTTN